jgi:hypothetical protein
MAQQTHGLGTRCVIDQKHVHRAARVGLDQFELGIPGLLFIDGARLRKK